MRSLLVLLIACGSPRAETPQPLERPSQAEHETPAVAVHEWGLVDVDLATGTVELAAGPGRPATPVIARKPVLYLHLLQGDAQALTVRARVPGGRILEHWPPAELTDEMVTWSVRVTHGVCGPSRGPIRDLARESVACNSTDGFCETPELPRYATDDHDCIDAAGTPAGLLFYRASVSAERLPLRVERNGMIVSVTALDDWDTPREMLRLSTNIEGRWPAGRVVVARAAIPRRGESIAIPVPTDVVDPAAERAAMTRTLGELGLTASEARAFVEAWSDELFGSADLARWRRAPPPQDVLLYWLSQSQVNRIAAIDASPTSITLSRAFLVRVTLPAVETD